MKKLSVVIIVALALLAAAALVVGVLACGLCRQRQATSQPTVKLLSPPEGTQVAVGRQIYVQARGVARGGVARIDFAVNGASIGSRSPAKSQRIFTTAQPWTAPASAGTYTLSATAYDADGQASAPAQVTITVREPGSFTQPSAPPAGGGVAPPGGGGQPPSGGGEAGWPEPVVDFRADRASLPAGECTTLRWDAEHVQEVYLDGAGVAGHGTRDVCPPQTQTYVLYVVLPSGESRDYTVTIAVSGSSEPTTGPDLVVLGVACAGGQSDEALPFQAQVQNQGDQPAEVAQWRWSVNHASAGPDQWTDGGTFNLDPGATTLLQGTIPARAAGQWAVYVEVRVGGETVTGNNQGSANFAVTSPQGDGGAAPAAPTNLRVPSWGMTYIRLAWDDNSDNEDGFQVFQQGRQDPVARTGPNETQAQIDNPPCGQTLQFRVRAFNAAGNSDYSNTITVQTAPCGGGQGSGPDLAVGEVWCSRTQSAGQDVPFRVEVRNVGDAAANGATWSWIVVERGQDPGANWMMGGTFDLPAGGSAVLEGTARGLSQGNWTFLVNVSLAGESNTANNQGSYDFAVAAAQGGGLAVTSVTASVSPAVSSGPCPQTIHFTGQIVANGAGAVTYRWERSNGEVGPTQSLTFNAAGTKTVTSADWTLNQSGTYWAKLHVLTPNDLISFQAKFTLNCGPSFQVTLASVNVNPTSFTGSCPKTVTFNGTIKTNGPGTVTYRWVRNGEEGSTKSITFNAAGTQTVTGDWTMNTSGTYRMSLHILEPNDLRSNEAQFQLTCSGGPPAKPTNLRVTGRSKTSIQLAWNDRSDNETYFQIEISPPPYTSWGLIGTEGPNAVTHQTSFALTCGETFRFRVRACNDAGCSAWSNEVEGTTLPCN